MACRRQRLTDAGEIGAGDVFGERERGQTMRMGRILVGLVEFALQILLRDFRIAQGHADVFVAEQPHERREADPEPKHFCGEAVPQTVGRHMGGGAAGALRSLG